MGDGGPQFPSRNRQLEAAPAGTSRIHVKDPALLPDQRLVRVPRHDDANARGAWIRVQPGEVVNDEDAHFARLKDFGFPQLLRPRALVVVAANRSQWRQAAECFEDERVADVASVNDEIAALEERPGLRPQETVRVGDQADA